jgi:hypothetical protein
MVRAMYSETRDAVNTTLNAQALHGTLPHLTVQVAAMTISQGESPLISVASISSAASASAPASRPKAGARCPLRRARTRARKDADDTRAKT